MPDLGPYAIVYASTPAFRGAHRDPLVLTQKAKSGCFSV